LPLGFIKAGQFSFGGQALPKIGSLRLRFSDPSLSKKVQTQGGRKGSAQARIVDAGDVAV
jgi:hypothetical protein